MRDFLNTLLFSSIAFFAFAQPCATLNSWSQTSNNGDGTCTYSVSIEVNSGNGASGTATFSIGTTDVHVESGCICNPTTITFPITVTCGSAVTIDVFYDAPGQGNDCSGSTGEFTLPVEWEDLRLENNGFLNTLYWSTSSEVNNEKFIVHHSLDGHDFENIGEVPGAGQSSQLKKYSFSHNYSKNRTCFYRIVQLDLNGNNSYSNILVFKRKDQIKVDVYPNPIKRIIYLDGNEFLEWSVQDASGKEILSGNSTQIDAKDFLPGVYYLRIINAETIQLETLVKF